MLRDTALAIGETYHIYNRGAHKQAIFTDGSDYLRMQMLMYLNNHGGAIVIRDILSKYKGRSYVEAFEEEKPDSSLVEVLAYCLMPNHFHIVLRQSVDGGITKFIRKIGTAYSMYFNTKYGHSGTLFQGRFKSSHVDNEPYFRYIFSYVHLNPVDLVVPGWEEKGVEDSNKVRAFLNGYPHSSFYDYSVAPRPQRAILAYKEAPDFLKQQNDLEEMLKGIKQYRQVLT